MVLPVDGDKIFSGQRHPTRRVYKRCLDSRSPEEKKYRARMASVGQVEEEAENSDTRSVDLFDEPIPSGSDVEREIRAIENEDSRLTLRDFLRETWNSSFDAARNIRLMIGSVSKYLFDHRKIDTSVRRIREALAMRVALKEIHRLWDGPQRCLVERMLSHVRENPRTRALIARRTISGETFDEWVREHRLYVDALSRASTDEVDRSREDVPESQEWVTGLDALFDHTYAALDDDRISQFIAKLENGRSFTARSPGEIGAKLIRLNVYDVKDIAKRDQRIWWKHAKFRAQFLCSSERADRKMRILRELLDEAANDLRRIPGVRTEARNVAHDGGN